MQHNILYDTDNKTKANTANANDNNSNNTKGLYRVPLGLGAP